MGGLCSALGSHTRIDRQTDRQTDKWGSNGTLRLCVCECAWFVRLSVCLCVCRALPNDDVQILAVVCCSGRRCLASGVRRRQLVDRERHLASQTDGHGHTHTHTHTYTQRTTHNGHRQTDRQTDRRFSHLPLSRLVIWRGWMDGFRWLVYCLVVCLRACLLACVCACVCSAGRQGGLQQCTTRCVLYVYHIIY